MLEHCSLARAGKACEQGCFTGIAGVQTITLGPVVDTSICRWPVLRWGVRGYRLAAVACLMYSVERTSCGGACCWPSLMTTGCWHGGCPADLF